MNENVRKWKDENERMKMKGWGSINENEWKWMNENEWY